MHRRMRISPSRRNCSIEDTSTLITWRTVALLRELLLIEGIRVLVPLSGGNTTVPCILGDSTSWTVLELGSSGQDERARLSIGDKFNLRCSIHHPDASKQGPVV